MKAKGIKPVKHVVVQNENAHTHVSNSNVRGGEMSTSEINVSELERDLRAQVSGEVRFDDGSHAAAARAWQDKPVTSQWLWTCQNT